MRYRLPRVVATGSAVRAIGLALRILGLAAVIAVTARKVVAVYGVLLPF